MTRSEGDSTAATIESPMAAAGVAQAKRFRAVFTVVMLPMFLASVDQTLLAAATPAIAVDLGGLADTTWIALAYLLCATVTIPLYGRLGDRVGRRPMLAAALAVFGLGSALGALAPGMGVLVAARALQGLGGGGLMVLSQALIGELVAPRERARYQGYFISVFTLAGLGGPALGGLVVHYAHWRWLFAGVLPLAAFALWRVLRVGGHTPRVPPASEPSRFDLPGVLLFAAAASVSLLWLSFVGHRFAWISWSSAALLASAALLWPALIGHERRHAQPFLPLDLLALPGMPALAGSIVIVASAMFALVFFLPIYLQLGHGRTASVSGLLLMPLTLGMASGSLFTGRWIARTGVAGTLPRWGLALAGVLTLTLAGPAPSGPVLSALMVGCGFGLGTVMPNAQIVAQTRAGPARLGAAASLVSLARALGSSLGTAVFAAAVFGQLGAEVPTVSGTPPPPAGEALAQAMRWSFAGLGVVLLLGALLATRLPRLDLQARDVAHERAAGIPMVD